jgi:hypothetical protein
MSRRHPTRLRRAALIAVTVTMSLITSEPGTAADGTGGEVDGSVTVAALVVTGVTPPVTLPRAGDLVTVRVQVRNDLARPISALGVDITGAVSAGATLATLAAGQTAELALPVWFCTAGPTTITATASGLDGASPVEGMPGQSTVPVGAGPGCASDPSVDRFPIRVSTSPDRSNPIPLDGRLVGGIVHVFVDPANPALAATRIRQVEFRIDGGRLITEKVAPFDLARTRGSSARGLDTTLLTNGTHTVSAVVRLRNGTTQPSTATFIVDNGASAKSISYSNSPDRSASQPLDGATLTGRQIYIFVSPTTPVVGATVWFFRNGRLIRVESRIPYDLGGTARNGDARPFALTGLRRGTHTITVEFRLPGGVTITQRASFTRP